MASLIACLSSGKGTWQHIDKLIDEQNWDSIYLIADNFGIENFKPKKPVSYVVINQDNFLLDMSKSIEIQLKGKIKDFEIALNMISGSGKEHMAVLSALMKLGLGIRMIALTPDGIKEI